MLGYPGELVEGELLERDSSVRIEPRIVVLQVAWREHATSFDQIVGEFTGGERIDVGDEAVQARIAAVTDGFWELTGARFAAGGPPEPNREGIVLKIGRAHV